MKPSTANVAVTSEPLFRTYTVSLGSAQMHLFGFLLESIEGLGYHSEGDERNEMNVQVSKDLIPEFESFLSTLPEITAFRSV